MTSDLYREELGGRFSRSDGFIGLLQETGDFLQAHRRVERGHGAPDRTAKAVADLGSAMKIGTLGCRDHSRVDEPACLINVEGVLHGFRSEPGQALVEGSSDGLCIWAEPLNAIRDTGHERGGNLGTELCGRRALASSGRAEENGQT